MKLKRNNQNTKDNGIKNKEEVINNNIENETLEETKNYGTYIVNGGSKLKNFIKSNKKKTIILICVIAIIFIALICSTIFALVNINNTNIISGVTVNGIDISNMSQEEAVQKLNEITNQKLKSNIVLKAEDFEYSMSLSQIETTYNIEQAVYKAYDSGRNGNIFLNNYEIIKTKIFGKDIELEYTYNEELLDTLLNDMKSKVPDPITEATYCIEDDILIITKGTTGNSINTEEVKQIIIDEILSNNTDIELNIDFIQEEPNPIDIDAIYEEVYTEPQDAYYTTDPFEIYPHVNGIDFDLEAARELLKEDKDEYEIKLTITIPDVTIDEIGEEAFPDLLSSFSTKYDASNTNRTTNLKLAMNKLDGVIVAAGETFSYNETLGKRTAEAGYKEAGGYAEGRVVQTLAGGICQISSTLYDAVVYANLEIVERHNHMFLAGYVGAGKDATVVYGALDFKFKNTRNYPIMIKTTIGNGIAKIDIYGIKEEVEYEVEISTKILSYSTYDVIYENDSSLAEGKQKVTQSGMNGCKSITYKILKLNGVEISREVLSSDTYDPMDKIINVGTKKTTNTSKNTTKKTTTKENTTNSNTTTGTNTPTNTTTNTTTTNTTSKESNTTTETNNSVDNTTNTNVENNSN